MLYGLYILITLFSLSYLLRWRMFQTRVLEMIEVCIASFFIDTTAGLLLAVAMTIPILQVQYISFVCSVVHRALLYGPNSAFIAQA